MNICSPTIARRVFQMPGLEQCSKTSPGNSSPEILEHCSKNEASAGIDPTFVPTNPEELQACLNDPVWRVSSGAIYKIMVKAPDGDGNSVVPFIPNRAQRRLMERLWHRNIILKARQLGFCVEPSTRVLTADLQWVRIDSLQPGDEVVAVDEQPPGGRGKARRMRTATVQATATVHRMAHRITFDDGRSVVCTDMHPWLTRKAGDCAQWRSLSGQGNQVVGRIKVGTQVRWVAKPWDAPTVEDGWFGGMLDGEGCMSKSNTSAGINVSQREGPVWDRLVRYCEDRGYSHCIESDKPERLSKHGTVPVPKIAFGRMDEMFRVIGQTRPTRFIGRRFWEDRELPGKRNGDVGWATVTSIEPVGDQPMIDLQTSTGTYIAEGFVSHNTTLVAILWLDHALFNHDQRCGIIAQDREAAEIIFRDKVKLAYDRLPDFVRAARPLKRDSASELLFAHNNSSIRVATSMRSGTIHRLHISEYGKICAKYPDKAREVSTGSLPAVPTDGIAIIESTAEGQEGDFFDKTQAAIAQAQSGTPLTPKSFRMHFYAWWQEPSYTIAQDVVMIPKDRDYFARVEADTGAVLTNGQRNWYVSTRDSEFSGDPEKMWQEYPSSAKEAFQVSTEGTYYAVQLAQVRKDGRICKVPWLPGVAVNTFWDIGNSDGTAIWFHQRVGFENRFINFIEGWGESYAFYVNQMQAMGYVWGEHYLPHDASHKRQQGHRTASPEDELREFSIGGTWRIVPVVDRVINGIQKTRDAFGSCFFDEEKTALGIAHLSNYRKTWSKSKGAWQVDTPSKVDGHSEAPDALRQFAQGYEAPRLIERARKTSNWRTA